MKPTPYNRACYFGAVSEGLTVSVGTVDGIKAVIALTSIFLK